MHISLTRLHLRGYRFLLPFTLRNAGITIQLRTSPGFVAGRTGVESLLGYWTMTMWKDEEAMKNFRNTLAHGAAMPKLLDWCDEASVAMASGEALMNWQEAYAVMRDFGRVSPVRNPTARHLAKKTVPAVPHFYKKATRQL